jgi:hypothetical protein
MIRMPNRHDFRYFPGLRQFRDVPLWKIVVFDGDYPERGSRYVCDWSFDIENTMLSGIRNAMPTPVAFTFCDRIRPLFGEKLEAEAAKRGAVVLWWSGTGAQP